VVGHLNSGTSIPASKIYSDAASRRSARRRPIPSTPATATRPRSRGGRRCAPGGTLGKYAVKELKGKNIAVIDDRTAYGQGVADEFEKGVKGAGGKTVAREFTNDKATTSPPS